MRFNTVMPLTPFHVTPNALVGSSLHRYLDMPALLLVNLAIDLEPLLIFLLGLNTPLHAYAHTLLGGAVVGVVFGWVWWHAVRGLERLRRVRYPLTFRAAVISGVIGAWLHVLIDAIMHKDMRPFFPSDANQLYQLVSTDMLQALSVLLLIPVLLLIWRYHYWQTLPQQLSLVLLMLSMAAMAVLLVSGIA